MILSSSGYSPSGQLLAKQGLQGAKQASCWKDADQLVQGSLATIAEDKNSPSVEQAIAGLAVQMGKAQPLSYLDSAKSGMVAAQAIVQGMPGPLVAVLAQVVLDSMQDASQYRDGDTLAGAGLGFMAEHPQIGESERALARLGWVMGSHSMSYQSSYQARLLTVRALGQNPEGDLASQMAQLASQAANAATKTTDADLVAGDGLQAILQLPSATAAHKALAQSVLNQTASGISYESSLKARASALREISGQMQEIGLQGSPKLLTAPEVTRGSAAQVSRHDLLAYQRQLCAPENVTVTPQGLQQHRSQQRVLTTLQESEGETALEVYGQQQRSLAKLERQSQRVSLGRNLVMATLGLGAAVTTAVTGLTSQVALPVLGGAVAGAALTSQVSRRRQDQLQDQARVHRQAQAAVVNNLTELAREASQGPSCDLEDHPSLPAMQSSAAQLAGEVAQELGYAKLSAPPQAGLPLLAAQTISRASVLDQSERSWQLEQWSLPLDSRLPVETQSPQRRQLEQLPGRSLAEMLEASQDLPKLQGHLCQLALEAAQQSYLSPEIQDQLDRAAVNRLVSQHSRASEDPALTWG